MENIERKLLTVYKLVALLLGLAVGSSAFADRATFNTRHTDRKLTLRYAFGFSTSFFFVSPSSEIKLAAEEAGQTVDDYVKFEPNIQFYHNVGFSYKWIALSGSIPVDKSDESIESKGKSDATEYKLNFHTTYLTISAFHQDFKGMFQVEPKNLTVVDDKEIYPQFPDMTVQKTGAEFLFKLSPRSLSFGALYDQSMIQTRSGGSWLLRLTYNQFDISNGGAPIIPDDYNQIYENDGLFTEIGATDYSVGAGYGYTAVWNKSFYLGGAFAYGMSISDGTYTVDDEVKTYSSEQFSSIYLLFSTGVNAKSFFTGFSYIVDSISVSAEEFSVTTPKNFGELYIGWRF